MQNLIKQQEQYIHLGGNYQLLLPMDFETSIAPDDSVRFLSHILEELNYTRLYQVYSQKGRKPSVEPSILFKIVVYADRSDTTTFIPFLENMYEDLGKRYQNIIADAGYESEENYLYLEEQGQEPYIKPVMYEKWKKKSFKRDISKREKVKS